MFSKNLIKLCSIKRNEIFKFLDSNISKKKTVEDFLIKTNIENEDLFFKAINLFDSNLKLLELQKKENENLFKEFFLF